MPIQRVSAGQPFQPRARDWNQIAATVDRVERERAVFGRTAKGAAPKRLYVKNTAAETIPIGAIVEPFNLLETTNAVLFEGRKPTATPPAFYLVNVEKALVQNAVGEVVIFDHTRALYATADGEPGFGETWGPTAASWELHKDEPGFIATGRPADGYAGFLQTAPADGGKVRVREDDELAYLEEQFDNLSTSAAYNAATDILINFDVYDAGGGDFKIRAYIAGANVEECEEV